MSDNGTATHAASQTDEVAAYVDLVRRALGDLSAEEIEDLTSGMEADLGELLTERGGPLETLLGTPGAYATELRQAAGLPERPRTNPPQILDRAWLAGRRSAAEAYLRRHPWLDATWSFLVTLRPAWWVLRGLVAAYVLVHVLSVAYAPTIWPTSPAMLVIGLPSVVLSVLLGRWSSRQWGAAAGSRPEGRGSDVLPGLRVLLALANLVAVPASILAVQAVPPTAYVQVGAQAPAAPTGLSLNGAAVDNVYVYDAQGHRLTDVRLFDSDGQSLVLDRKEDVGTGVTLPGRGDVYGQWWTNVFPRAYTVNGEPYAVNPLASPGSPQYQGQEQWKPPPSVAPLLPSGAPATTTGSATTGPATTGSAATATTAPPISTTAPTSSP